MPRLLLFGILALAACNEVNKEFCDNPAHAGDPHCLDAGMKCTSRDMCPSGMPVCDLTDNGGTCVACTATDPGTCSGMTPVCSPDRTCVACSTDMQCNGVCLDTGECAAAADIIFVSPAGDPGPGCFGMAANTPCTIDRALMIASQSATRKILKLSTGHYQKMGPMGQVIDTDVTIDARDNAVFEHITDMGDVITINAGKRVKILGGTIQNGQGVGLHIAANAIVTLLDTTVQMNTANGVLCTGCTLTMNRVTVKQNGPFVNNKAGIEMDGGSLTLQQSLIASNNAGGLLVTEGQFVVVNNFFLNNGNANSTLAGGVAITSSMPGQSRLEFNTVVGNRNTGGTRGQGIECNVVGVRIRNSVVWDNGSVAQVSGSCFYEFSDVGPTPTLPLDGGNNLTMAPVFVDENNDIHLMPSSPLRDKGTMTAGGLTQDIDDQPRQMGSAVDMGADELP